MKKITITAEQLKKSKPFDNIVGLTKESYTRPYQSTSKLKSVK